MHVILDIDGTLADATHRAHFLKEKIPNWDAFFDPQNVFKDPPIDKAKAAVTHLQEQKYGITVITGRVEALRDTTTRWLLEHFGLAVDDDSLLMRPMSNMLSAREYKAQQMQQILAGLKAVGERSFLFIDDDERALQIYSVEGIALRAPQCWDHLFTASTALTEATRE